MLSDDPFEVAVSDTHTAYSGMVWDVVSERFAYGEVEITREFIRHTGAVGVVAVDDEDRVLLIKQYRHPVRAREWELPAGLRDVAGEDPLTTARRELAEETDHVAAEWEHLADVALSPGSSSEIKTIYLARGISRAAETFDRDNEEADLEVRWVPINEVVAAIRAGQVRNATMITGVLLAREALSEHR